MNSMKKPNKTLTGLTALLTSVGVIMPGCQDSQKQFCSKNICAKQQIPIHEYSKEEAEAYQWALGLLDKNPNNFGRTRQKNPACYIGEGIHILSSKEGISALQETGYADESKLEFEFRQGILNGNPYFTLGRKNTRITYTSLDGFLQRQVSSLDPNTSEQKAKPVYSDTVKRYLKSLESTGNELRKRFPAD
jgi:hypothetical protein